MELARGLSVAALRGSRPPKASAEALYKIMSIQVATFLLHVCHVVRKPVVAYPDLSCCYFQVLFMFDGPTDHRMFELLHEAEMFAVDLTSSLPDSKTFKTIVRLAESDYRRIFIGNVDPDLYKHDQR